jgi:anti-sigma factor RsiW
MGVNKDDPLIARDATYYKAPEALRDRVRGALREEAREQARPQMWRWGGIAASFLLVALVSWNVGRLQTGGGEQDSIIRDVAAAHVRSLMLEGHLNDVASTDQHTVKPWFEGKLDFAPVVTDFGAAGYTLMGGRLDYLDGHPAAALTYRHRLHVVNLFQWPATEAGDRAPVALARHGYALVHWRRGGIEYWAASDIASEDLLAFARLLS